HSYILLFTDHGRCYWLKVFEIPEASRTARGKAIVNLVQFQEKEKIKAFVTLREFAEDQYITMCTRNGLVKKTSLKAFSRPRNIGILAIKLNEDDELIDARITGGSDDILLATRNSYCNRFNESDVRPSGRFTMGVKGIGLRDKDYVISMTVIKPEYMTENSDETAPSILAISENGYGKRTTIDSYTVHKRGSKGVITLKTTLRNGHLAALMMVNEGDDLMIITQEGMIIRQKVDVVSLISRNTQGVRLINLTGADKVRDITYVPSEPDDEEIDAEAEKLRAAVPAAIVGEGYETGPDFDEEEEETADLEENEDIEETEENEDV
ncbi:MAG: DNA gyrase C-terminal beta-propeller domain-containing protein, partial [Candidatus Cloacimonadota bacterium]